MNLAFFDANVEASLFLFSGWSCWSSMDGELSQSFAFRFDCCWFIGESVASGSIEKFGWLGSCPVVIISISTLLSSEYTYPGSVTPSNCGQEVSVSILVTVDLPGLLTVSSPKVELPRFYQHQIRALNDMDEHIIHYCLTNTSWPSCPLTFLSLLL